MSPSSSPEVADGVFGDGDKGLSCIPKKLPFLLLEQGLYALIISTEVIRGCAFTFGSSIEPCSSLRPIACSACLPEIRGQASPSSDDGTALSPRPGDLSEIPGPVRYIP